MFTIKAKLRIAIIIDFTIIIITITIIAVIIKLIMPVYYLTNHFIKLISKMSIYFFHYYHLKIPINPTFNLIPI